ncbi:MAG: zinc ribbon domain-containing protein [Caldilineaceae bacterium]
MTDVRRCVECDHENPPKTRFCDQCGASLYSNKVRAFALIEGTAGVGKSTLANRLVHNYMKRTPYINTLLHLGQSHTYAPLDPDNINASFTAEDHVNYLEQIYDTLSFLSQPPGLIPQPKLACIIETLHLTLAVRPGLLSQPQILAYDQRLAALGCKLIFIKVSPESHWERCIWERRNNGFITKYGAKYGRNLEEIHSYYVAEQRRLLELFEYSSMQKLLVDGESSPETLAEIAFDFWVS